VKTLIFQINGKWIMLMYEEIGRDEFYVEEIPLSASVAPFLFNWQLENLPTCEEVKNEEPE
jgi:hypothetical protein